MNGGEQMAQEVGVNAYIRKPVDLDEFRKVIEHIDIGTFWRVVNQAPPPETFGAS